MICDFMVALRNIIEEYACRHGLSVVMHFPHSSLAVPPSFWDDVGIDEDYFHSINLLMGDCLLLDLFASWPYPKVVAPYSRLYVDVEKYWDDSIEPMARFGLGAVYANDVFLRPLHKKKPGFMKEAKAYYETYQKNLSSACAAQKGDVLLLDIHSFNAHMAGLLSDCRPLPDICLGQNGDRSACPELLTAVTGRLEALPSVSYAINYPYSGSMLPSQRKPNQEVYSLMFEFNKRLYL